MIGNDSVDVYISEFPIEVQEILTNIRTIIFEEAPEITEKISYQMPTYWRGGNLFHFAAFKSHIGFYPTPSGITPFEEALTLYKHGKGSIRFPLNEPIPYELIRKMVQYRLKETEI